jgi:hypothetical protein
LTRGRPARPVRGGGGRTGRVAAQPRGHGDVGGQPLEGLADVGGVADQVHRPVPDVGDDQVEQFAGQDQRGVVALAGDPQPGKDRQAHRPGEERQVHDDADHHPAVTPRWPVAAGAVAVVVPGRAVQFWAGTAPQRVVDGQHQRSAGRDQGVADEVQQDQAELVSRPAGGGEEAVGQVVVAPAGQPGADQHPGDGAQARLAQEPGHQCLEGPHGRRGEAGRNTTSRSASERGRLGVSIGGCSFSGEWAADARLLGAARQAGQLSRPSPPKITKHE